MESRQNLETALFDIIEDGSSDQEKSEKLTSLLETIQFMNIIYAESYIKLQQRGILNKKEKEKPPILFSIEARNNKVQTPLVLAVEKDLVNCVKVLVENRADFQHMSYEETPLMIAAKTGKSALLQLLVAAKANLNAESGMTRGGETALMLAAKHGYADCIQILLDAKANIHLRSKEYPKSNALTLAVEHGHTECTRLLLNQADEADINNTNQGSHNAISIAIENNQMDCLSLLLTSKKVNLERVARLGCTPLQYAATYRHEEALKLLIAAKANLNIKDKEENTPLMMTITNMNMFSALLDAGADVNAINKRGETVLIRAIAWKQDEAIVYALCDKKADVNYRDNTQTTALERATIYSDDQPDSLKRIRALLECHAIIHDPLKLLNYLDMTTPRREFDTDTIYCYEKLSEHLEKYPLTDKGDIMLNDRMKLNAKAFFDFIKTLKQLSYFGKIEATKKLEEHIALPRDILNLISLYDNSVGLATLSSENSNDVEDCVAKFENKIKEDKMMASQMRFFTIESGEKPKLTVIAQPHHRESKCYEPEAPHKNNCATP